MKLEYLESGNSGRPMLLLYGGGLDEVALLRKALRDMAEGRIRQLAVHNLPFVQSVDDCQLRATLGKADLGVVRGEAANDFAWTLDAESWLGTDELLEPFCREESGIRFQYLNPAKGPEVIYSTDRSW